LKPSWISKTDPVHHPVRFLARTWQQKVTERFGIPKTDFTPKHFGQLKCFMNALGDLTPDVIDWMLDSVNWWHFCQQVRAELKVRFVPDYPTVGFLLQYRGIALRLMHARLCNSIAWTDFITKLEKRWYGETKQLLLVYAQGNPEQLLKIDAAQTLTDMELMFVEVMDESMAASTPRLFAINCTAIQSTLTQRLHSKLRRTSPYLLLRLD
jgi:hypothetical protein